MKNIMTAIEMQFIKLFYIFHYGWGQGLQRWGIRKSLVRNSNEKYYEVVLEMHKIMNEQFFSKLKKEKLVGDEIIFLDEYNKYKKTRHYKKVAKILEKTQ